MQASKLQLLQSMPIFGGLKENAIEEILAASELIHISKQQYFFQEGDSARSMFVLESGQVRVSKQAQDKIYQLRTLEQGDCFGEMALMDFNQRSASVQAVEDCCAIEIPTQALYIISKKYPEQFTLIQMNMGREICRRLRDTEDRIFKNLSTGEPLSKSQMYHVI